MSNKPVFSSSTSSLGIGDIVSTNKVLKNTYMLLGMTLAFSAVTASITMALNLPHMFALVLMLVGFGLLFVVNRGPIQRRDCPLYLPSRGLWALH